MPQVVDEDGDIFEVNADGSYTHVGNTRAAPQQGPAPVTLGRPRPQEAPSGYRWSDSGLQAIPGGPADKPREDPNAAKLPTGYRWKADGSGAELIPGVAAPGDNAKGDPGKAGAYKSVIQQVNRLYELYNQGIGTTSGLSGILDYLPSDANAAFDTAGAALGDQGNAAFKVPGMGAQSDADAARFVAANQPQSGDRDVAALEKLRAIRQRLENNMAAVGLPAPQWGYDLQGRAVAPASNDQPIPAANLGGSDPMGGLTPEQMGGLNRQAALQGALSRDQGVVAGDPNATDTAIPVPPEFQNELISYVMQNRATVTPEQIDAKVRELASRFNYPAQAGNSVDVVNAVRKGAPYQGIQPSRRNMTGLEQVQNQFIQSPLGSTAAGYLNAGGMGIPKMLSADEYGAIENTNPMASLAGEVGGAIMGSSLIGRAGANIAGKVAPRLLGGGRGAQFGRNLATDATYGGIYGGTTEGDPVTGALAAGLGSGLGQGVASGIGRLATPVIAPAAKRLNDAGVTLSLGQILRDRGGVSGKVVGGVEDRLAGLPGVGDFIQSVRTRGVEDFNVLDMNNAVKGVGGRVLEPGQAGYAQADQAVSDAYNSSLGPMRLTPDAQFNSALAGSPDYADTLIRPFIGQGGDLSGQNLQAAKQALQAETLANQGVPGGFSNRQRLGTLQDELLGLAERQAPDLAQGYRAADEAFASLAPIRSAVANSVNKGGIYSPAQKGIALRTTDKSAGKRNTALGNRPGMQLQQDAQALLPSQVPDSGTIGRGIVAGLPALAAGGGMTGYVDPSTAAMMALPAMLYTKAGQKLAAKVLLGDRPKSVKAVGSTIRKRKGLFGSAAAPLLIENSTN